MLLCHFTNVIALINHQQQTDSGNLTNKATILYCISNILIKDSSLIVRILNMNPNRELCKIALPHFQVHNNDVEKIHQNNCTLLAILAHPVAMLFSLMLVESDCEQGAILDVTQKLQHDHVMLLTIHIHLTYLHLHGRYYLHMRHEC